MLELAATVRTAAGKKAKHLRGQGQLPGVLYGWNTPSCSVTVARVDFERIYRDAGESTLITLKVSGEEATSRPVNVLIYDVQRDPIRDFLIHADFYAVRMDKLIQTEVPVVFTGEAPAVKLFGADLIKAVQSLEVEALPKDLPHELHVDLSHLTEVDMRIHVREILLPPGVVVLADPEEVVAIVSAHEAEAVREEVAAEVVTEVLTEREIRAAEKAKESTEAEDVEK